MLAPVFAGLDPAGVAEWDVIPDIHGMGDRLEGLLTALGYVERGGAWRPREPDRRAIFLGDFIDRGPDQARVLDITRRMIGEGVALAVMGNHELNALHYATPDPETGAPLRAHSPKNTAQHAAFLEAFPPGSAARRDALGWVRRLPLFLDLGGFRVAHAAWLDPAIATIRAESRFGVLEGDLLVRAADPDDPFGAAVEATAKGPEADLPAGVGFRDKGGHLRRRSRIAWWDGAARSWREIAASVPDPGALPDTPVPEEVRRLVYPPGAPPVFVGHYWLTGEPAPRSANVFCLDYSAGAGGPLVSYRQPAKGGSGFDLRRLTSFG